MMSPERSDSRRPRTFAVEGELARRRPGVNSSTCDRRRGRTGSGRLATGCRTLARRRLATMRRAATWPTPTPSALRRSGSACHRDRESRCRCHPRAGAARSVPRAPIRRASASKSSSYALKLRYCSFFGWPFSWTLAPAVRMPLRVEVEAIAVAADVESEGAVEAFGLREIRDAEREPIERMNAQRVRTAKRGGLRFHCRDHGSAGGARNGPAIREDSKIIDAGRRRRAGWPHLAIRAEEVYTTP